MSFIYCTRSRHGATFAPLAWQVYRAWKTYLPWHIRDVRAYVKYRGRWSPIVEVVPGLLDTFVIEGSCCGECADDIRKARSLTRDTLLETTRLSNDPIGIILDFLFEPF